MDAYQSKTQKETPPHSTGMRVIETSRKPIHGIYNSYFKIRGVLVPISQAPAAEEY